MRAIDTKGLAVPATRPEGGPPPQLAWIEIADLVIDPRYQREITTAGRRNVQQIAGTFDWAFFAPVVVSPVEGGRFAIVDGQHRTTAAALIGKKQVPCAIVIADDQKQAQAFRAVNGNVTKVVSNHMHRAAVAAGDPDALDLEAMAAEGGCRILRSPTQLKDMKPGDTQSIAALKKMRAEFGRARLVTALWILSGGPASSAGLIYADMLWGLCRALEGHAAINRNNAREMFARVNLYRAWEDAGGARKKGDARKMRALIYLNLMERIEKAKGVA